MQRVYEPGSTVVGKYRLLELLGEGGMGTVWRAHNETLDVDVAVKVLRRDDPENVEGPLAGDRLLQEARAAARLGHPAIARVFDFGTSERGDAFIVMELLEGEDLAEALARRGRLTPTKAVATLLPIAHALAAAHQKGIVHRDIKPENIFLARAEDRRVQPKLVDFGIAKIERTKNQRLTQTGTMLGSPLYMSPEQARGDDVDQLADVWAVCVVLYEMVAGRTPFEGKNYNALLYSIIADDPQPLDGLGFSDEAFWRILAKGLAKDPERRWQSMRDLGSELARWMLRQGQPEDITGASVSMQWLHRMRSSADLLASMVPPPSETVRPPSSLLELAEGVGADMEAEERLSELERTNEWEPDRRRVEPPAPVVRAATPVLRHKRRRRLVAIALASAALGAAVAVTALIQRHDRGQRELEERRALQLGEPAVAIPEGTSEPRAVAVALAERTLPTSLPSAPAMPSVEAALAPTSAEAEPTSADQAPSAAPAEAAGTAKPSKARGKRGRPSKKSKLKNPFD